ncbi:MAG: hypothetical protein U0L51_04225 [Olegusella sp.]|nr:hypothetical protein [Olegusella sp.]
MISRMIATAEGRSLLTRADAAGFLHGHLDREDGPYGWVRPLRLLPTQLRAIGSCQAWHPGLYRRMATATAGVSLEFETNASEVALEIAPDEEPAATRRLRERVFAPAETFDGVACEVDGRVREPGWGEGLAISVDAAGEDAGPLPPGARLVPFALDDPAATPGAPQMLPGFGPTHRVRIWLPCLRGVRVRGLWGDGTAFTPVDPRPSLLAIGDGPTQGMACGNPALAWPTRLSERLGFDLVNQGIHRQVFQSGMLSGLGAVNGIAGVVVALGAAYRREPCQARLVARDVRAFLAELARLFPDAPIWVVTPLWHNADRVPEHAGSCISELGDLLAEGVAAHDRMELVDGLSLLDHRVALLADAEEMPGAKGAHQIARRLETRIRESCDGL